MEFRMTDINLILKNGKITTLDPQNPEVQAIAIADVKSSARVQLMRL